MAMLNHSLRTLAVVLGLFLSSGLFAAIETASNRLTGTAIATSATVSAIDNKYTYMVANNTGGPPLWQQNSFWLKSGVGRITLGVDPNHLTYVSTSYTAKVTVSISYYSDLSLTTPQAVSTQTLVVSYNPAGATVDDRDMFEINTTNVLTPGEKVMRVKVTVTAVTNASNTPITAPVNLYLEASTEVERFYNLSLTSIPATSILSSTVNSANELVLNWGYIAGAESYDVEWTWVNNYDASGGALAGGPLNALLFDFSHNSTRVNVKGNSFAIPLIFDQGYVAFRVRAAGYAYNASSTNFEPVYGRWTSENASDFTYANFNATGHLYQVTLANAYRLKMNWQYNGSFAEEGKKKEVVSFYDGSLHNRQTITKTSADKKVLVGETMYDYEGRAAISVLPSPVAGSNMPLVYQVAFNRNNSSVAYTAADFDKDVTACAVSAPAMSTSYGTSRYYSSSNPEQTGAQAFLPDAGGYPYSQTEYAPDNTGRVRRQGGVGTTHQLNGGHETQYYYGHPFQEELDRLFGSDVGYAKHYNKTVTIDANGQSSVTYVDQEGRMIATGLAGDTVGKPLMALREGGEGTTSYAQYTVSNMVVDMLGKDDDADVDDDQDNNLLSSAGNMLEVSNQLVVASRSSYSFAYTLTGDRFTYECLPEEVCYNCAYELEIDILDQCGNRPTLTQGTLPITETLGTMSYDCEEGVATFTNAPTPLITTLDPGVYTVYKRLKVDQHTLDGYLTHYLEQSSCVTTEAEFVNAALATVDTTSCHATCTDCDDYQSPCETGYRMMLSDVSPNGQYAEYRDYTGTVNTAVYPVSVMNTSNVLRVSNANWRYPSYESNGNAHYYEADGTTISYIALSGTSPNYFPAIDNIANVVTISGLPYIEPQHLANTEDFTIYWRESWAISLVKYHPEYCYYDWCKGNGVVQSGSSTSSDEFDELLLSTTTRAAAITAGLLDPLANSDGSANQSSATDPYFRTGGLGASQYSAMEAKMLNYSGGYSIWKVAKIMTTCGNMFNATTMQINTCTGASGGDESNFITGDAEWENFKMLYFSLKQHYQQDKADASALTCDGYNGCIGTTTFDPAAAGMIDYSTFANSEFFDRTPTRQPCCDATFMYYSGKQKRFPNEDDILPLTGNTANDLAALQNSLNNNNTLLTGQCPIAASLQHFLTGLAGANQLKAGALDLQTTPYFSPTLYTALISPTSAYNVITYAGTGTGATLTLSFTGTYVSCGTAPTLVFGSSSSYSWANYNSSFRIASFSGLTDLGSGAFGIVAYIDHDMNPSTAPIPEYMTGTSGCLTISCTLPTECAPNALAMDLYTLLNMTTAGGDLSNGTATNLTTGGNYSTFFNASEINNHFTCSTTVDTYWRFDAAGVNPDEHRIQCTNTSGTPNNYWIRLTFSTDLASLTGAINSFSVPVVTSPTQMQMVVTHNTSSTTTVTMTATLMLDGGVNETLTLGTCGTPVPEPCEGAEYQRRRDLQALLNSKPGAAFTTTDNNLQNSPEFTNLLQLFGSGTYSWTTTTSPSNAQWINIAGNSQTCTLKLAFANTPGAGHAFNNIDHFGELVADEVNTVNGQAYNFTIVAWYSDGTSDLLNGSSCYAIRNCSVCTSAATSVYQNFDMVNISSPGYTSGLTHDAACPSAGEYTLTNEISVTCSDITLTGGDRNNVATGKYYYGIFPASATTTAWSKINTALAINTPYTFTCWYMDPTVATQDGAGTVQLIVNGTVISSAPLDDTRPGEWKMLTGTWNGMSTLANCTTEVKVVCSTDDPVQVAIDDISFYTTGCDPHYNPPVSPTYPYNPPCATNLINIATLNGQMQYQQYIQQVSAQFAADYTAHCIGSAVETFKVTFNPKEYQYTLYYYDQGDNLVRTVPPQGVTVIDLTADDDSDLDPNGQEIKDTREARLSNPAATKLYYTEHSMMTTYTYNSLNQLTKQVTPDGGTTYFWYDRLGRIAASQNAKQAAMSTQGWSYIIYDELNRPTEMGQLYTNTDLKAMSSVTLYSTLNAGNYPDNWAGTASSTSRSDVTKTYYDVAQSFSVSSFFSAGLQKNLRQRIAHEAIYDTYNGTNTAYTHATHYSYDIHGNAEEVVQEIPELSSLDDVSAGVYQGYKKMRYTYDLVGGGTRELAYQEGQPDQFFYRYDYDADNRVMGAFTSSDKRHWDRDAKYFYYQHEPKSRVELGNEKVQGADYMYTIHGWTKGVNSNGLTATHDMGKDAGTGSNAFVGLDEYGYSLSYFSGDFATIGTTSAIASISSSGLDAASPNMYNGNIRHMVTSIRYFGNVRAMAYKYDQLNRIRSSEQYTNYVDGSNSWNSGGSGNTPYKETYTYDHNGNIIRQVRNGQSGNVAMENLHYYYYTTSGSTYDPVSGTPSNGTNKLAYVTDGVSSGAYSTDIDNQSSNNYTYDQIGQLTGDVQEQAQTIVWTGLNKIRSVTRSSGSTKVDLEHHYDAGGRRYVKIAKPRPGGSAGTQDQWTYTYYVCDVVGNVLATYERTMALDGDAGTYDDKIKLKENHLYGSSRVGIKNSDLTLTTKTYNFTSYSGVYLQGTLAGTSTPALSATRMKHTINMKAYELTNHLGNVLVTVSDARQIINTGAMVTSFRAIVKSANDYSAFGAVMPGRTYTSVSHRYAFNGKEKNSDFTEGNVDFGGRVHDSRLGRWLSVDPKSNDYAHVSPYVFCANAPLAYVDPTGEELILTFESEEAKTAYTNSVNASLEGQFVLSLVDNKDGTYHVEINATADSKGTAGMTAEGKQFMESMSMVVDDPTVKVEQAIVYKSEATFVGTYQTNTLDMGDVEQFPIGTEATYGTTMTQQGAIVHETVEQYEKAKRGLKRGDYDDTKQALDHAVGMKAEGKVSGYNRIDMSGPSQDANGQFTGTFKIYLEDSKKQFHEVTLKAELSELTSVEVKEVK